MVPRVGLRAVALGLAATAACCSRSEGVKPGATAADPLPAKPTFTLFALAEVRGQVGPCGCTSDPLGDISRTASVIAEAKKAGPVLVVDAGSLLYAKSPMPPRLASQEDLKANTLVAAYQTMNVQAIGLGPADLANGAKSVRPARQAANVTATPDGPALEPPKVVVVGGARVGVFGVISPDAVAGLAIGDPIAAGQQAIAGLKKDGAQLIVALVQTTSKKDAMKLMRDIGGIDIAVAGLGVLAPEPDRVEAQPQKVGSGWLVIPGNRGQVISRVDVTLRGDGPLADAVGPVAAGVREAAIDKQLAALDRDLAGFANDTTADPAFVAQKKAERAQLAAERAQLASHPLNVPASGSYLTLEEVRINKTLACSQQVQDQVSKLYLATGELNAKAATGIAPQPAPKGTASYTGMAACDDCHSDAVAFWNKTVHAQAWQTLVERGQQLDLDCIGCHVTGWDKPGGSNLGNNDTLRNVQCEVCHGPGSIHVAKGGDERPFAVVKAPADDLCATQCHTKEHSDTFDRVAYLRDITGKGHGEQLRKKLGDGPTGAQLRKAALEKAGRMGPGCVR